MSRYKPLYIIDPETFFAGFTKQELEEEFAGLKQERARISAELKQVESDIYAVKSLIVKANCEARGVEYRVKRRSFEGLRVNKLWAHN